VFVGEAPGYDEDSRGVPFVGRAGAMLDALLRENGFRREDVFVTNAVRCRPPENRDPSVKELKACREYLVNELRSVQPKYIVALGNTALRALTGDSGVGKHRGAVLPAHPDFGNSSSVVVTAHPAAALRYPHFADQIREDLTFLRRTLDGSFSAVPLEWTYATDAQGLTGPVWAFDYETNAREPRDPFLAAYLCAIDVGAGPVKVFGGESVGIAAWQLDNAAQRGVRVVGHNASRFDRVIGRALFGGNVRCDDTMLMGFLLHEEWGAAKRLNLESLCAAELGVEPWKRDVVWNWRDAAKIPWDKAAEYNARDTRYTRELFTVLERKLKEDGAGTPFAGALWRVYDRLLLPASRALADMEQRGLYVNRANCDEASAEFTAQAERHLATINAIAGAQGLPDFNPRSPTQVGELLFKRLGLPPVNWTASGTASTNVEALKTLRELGAAPDLLNAILLYRKALRIVNTYSTKFARLADWQSMIYSSYSMVNTDSGRTASFDPNAQNIPRNKRVRRIIGAPPGKVVLAADFSQLELRTGASRYVFDEPNLRAAFERGEDPHRLLAASITGKPPHLVSSKERTDAKRANFLFLYGGEEDMYIRKQLEDYDIVKSREDARRERDAFFFRWSALPAGYERIMTELDKTGQVRSPLGTLRRLPNVFADNRSVKTEAYRVAINFVNQCFAWHLAAIGLVLLGGAGLDVRSFQHDAYLIYVDDDENAVRHASTQVRYLLEHGVPQVLRSEFNLEFDVPLKVDVSAGTAWTDDDRLCEHGIWMPRTACPSCVASRIAA
jgi:uracil-DNA glycosylase family 4